MASIYHEYSEKFAPKLFGSNERGLRHASNHPETKIAERMALRMLGAGDKRFTIAVTGQSNAAGHGSYFDETYTFAMARASAGAFKVCLSFC
jgi:hypothetical protein